MRKIKFTAFTTNVKQKVDISLLPENVYKIGQISLFAVNF